MNCKLFIPVASLFVKIPLLSYFTVCRIRNFAQNITSTIFNDIKPDY